MSTTMIVLGILFLVLIIVGMILLWYYGYYKKIPRDNSDIPITNPELEGYETEWSCIEEGGYVTRRNKFGNVECYSTSGVGCARPGCTKEILDKLDKNKVLTCGEDHMNKHDISGYCQDNHWCEKQRKKYNDLPGPKKDTRRKLKNDNKCLYGYSNNQSLAMSTCVNEDHENYKREIWAFEGNNPYILRNASSCKYCLSLDESGNVKYDTCSKDEKFRWTLSKTNTGNHVLKDKNGLCLTNNKGHISSKSCDYSKEQIWDQVNV